MRLIVLCAAALLLAGCAETASTSRDKVFGDAVSPRPKAIVVSDFTVSSDLVVIDRGYTARLERKIGPYPTFERKQRTLERVNDEIVGVIVATVREAGLEAQAGSAEGVSLAERVVVASGRLKPANPSAKKNEAGIGGGHSGVAAEMSLLSMSGFGRKTLVSFDAVPEGGKKGAGSAPGGADSVKLSPDVEAAARKIGRAAGDKIVAYAKEQGWLEKPDAGGADAAKPAAKESDKDGEKPASQVTGAQMVKLPTRKPVKKPAV